MSNDPKKENPKANAPCRYQAYNNITGKPYMTNPPVNCTINCDKCGWNPEVQARRIEAMKAKTVKPW